MGEHALVFLTGMKDFTPDMTFAADFHRQAGFEKFDTLLHNMSNWISAKQVCVSFSPFPNKP